MIAILSLFVVVTLSIVVTRIATVVLIHTGMSGQTARFQARSAFSGAGFTTSESEQVVNHPVRRRVALVLMLLGNAGIVTAVSSLILALVRGGDGGMGLHLKIPLLIAGLLGLWALANSKLFDRVLSRTVEWMLGRYTDLQVRDYAGLMRLGGDYRIVELGVQPGRWLDGRTLRDVRPAEEGVLVLGVASPGGEWLGTPGPDTRLGAGDTVVVYGRTQAIDTLQRRGRDADAHRDHREAVGEHERIAERERRQHKR